MKLSFTQSPNGYPVKLTWKENGIKGLFNCSSPAELFDAIGIIFPELMKDNQRYLESLKNGAFGLRRKVKP
jgi:hypothetical protein